MADRCRLGRLEETASYVWEYVFSEADPSGNRFFGTVDDHNLPLSNTIIYDGVSLWDETYSLEPAQTDSQGRTYVELASRYTMGALQNYVQTNQEGWIIDYWYYSICRTPTGVEAPLEGA